VSCGGGHTLINGDYEYRIYYGTRAPSVSVSDISVTHTYSHILNTKHDYLKMDLNRAARTENERTRQCADGHTHPHPTRRPESGRDLRAGFRSERRDEGGRTGMRWSLRCPDMLFFQSLGLGLFQHRFTQFTHRPRLSHSSRQALSAAATTRSAFPGTLARSPNKAPRHRTIT
jgi:hypothetical protein